MVLSFVMFTDLVLVSYADVLRSSFVTLGHGCSVNVGRNCSLALIRAVKRPKSVAENADNTPRKKETRLSV
jgi:hypothetical protein